LMLGCRHVTEEPCAVKAILWAVAGREHCRMCASKHRLELQWTGKDAKWWTSRQQQLHKDLVYERVHMTMNTVGMCSAWCCVHVTE